VKPTIRLKTIYKSLPLMMWAACAVALASPKAAALETDQFTVPPFPLADAGTELADEVMRRINLAVVRVNADAAGHARAAEKAGGGFWQRHQLRAVDAALTEGRLAHEVYDELAGPGLPECHLEQWLRKHRFAGVTAARFELDCGHSAYGGSPFARSPFIMSLSPTVRVFDVYCGADKIGHLVQQGYEYFDCLERVDARERRQVDAPEAQRRAVAAAVREGVDQERGFYGLALVGVYSNADLAANYAGLKLYQNLTRPVRVGQAVRPPLLVLRDGRWDYNPHLPASTQRERAESFLRPFITDHFNEALNPSLYEPTTRNTVRARWRDRGHAWVAFYTTTREAERERQRQIATWYGEPYGHSGFESLVTAADTCFDDRAAPPTHARVDLRPFPDPAPTRHAQPAVTATR
jgi:hypothetical protein